MRRPAIALMLAVVAVPGPVAARDLDGAIGEKLFRRHGSAHRLRWQRAMGSGRSIMR